MSGESGAQGLLTWCPGGGGLAGVKLGRVVGATYPFAVLFEPKSLIV